MSEQTKIEWCDSTFNPWIGCTKVSPACDHCYAERDMAIRHKRVEWGAGKPRSRTSAANWKLPERWNRERWVQCSCGWRGAGIEGGDGCGGCGKHATTAPTRRRVFSSSLADWLDNEVPIEWLVDFLDLVRTTPNLDWLLLTKRIGNWSRRIKAAIDYCDSDDPCELRTWLWAWINGSAPANVWIGATIANQPELERDLEKLYRVPARVRFISAEPMLSPLLFHEALTFADADGDLLLHWIIAGGESGTRARPSHPDWFRSLRDQCAAAGVAFLFKQWGEHLPGQLAAHPLYPNSRAAWRLDQRGDWWSIADEAGIPRDQLQSIHFIRPGKKAAGRLLDGIEHNAFPRSAP